jgi:hypothetical protein
MIKSSCPRKGPGCLPAVFVVRSLEFLVLFCMSTLPALRERLTANLICKALRAQAVPAGTYQGVSDLRDTLLALAIAADWHSRDGKAIVFRLVTVMPFPAKIAAALPDLLPQLQMAHCLGQIFDSTVVQN